MASKAHRALEISMAQTDSTFFSMLRFFDNNEILNIYNALAVSSLQLPLPQDIPRLEIRSSGFGVDVYSSATTEFVEFKKKPV